MPRQTRRTGCPSTTNITESDFSWGTSTARPNNVSINGGRKYYESCSWQNQTYRVGDFVFISSESGHQPYVAKLEQLCDLGLSSMGYQYGATVTWYMRADEIQNKNLRSEMKENEVVLSRLGVKAPSRLVDIETICGPCNVVTVPPNNTELALTDKYNRPQFFCRYSVANARGTKLKPILDEVVANFDESPMFIRKNIPTPVDCNVLAELQVTPIKLKKISGKENLYTPQRNVVESSKKAPNTVEKLAVNLEEIALGSKTPSRNLRARKTETAATPKSSNVERTTVRNCRPVRRSIFPLEDNILKETDTFNDTVSEEETDISAEIDSSTEISEDSESSSDEELERRTKFTRKGRSQKSKKESSFKRAAIRRAALTPSMPSRQGKTQKTQSDFEKALSKLHVCAVPDQLPCRENQFAEIYSFIEGKLLDQVGSCMYVSGVPGTGKTATVREVMKALEDARKLEEVPDFKFIEINGMKLSEPHQAYVQILRQLNGRKATAENAADILSDLFKNKRPKSSNAMIVLLVDELDLLWTRKQQVLYNIFDWPSHPNSRLVVVAIANTMDLPERMVMNKVASRMGLSRMTFQPYTFQELQQIVKARLSGLDLIDPDAVQFISRKVAALSGDARRALDVCRRAVELSETSQDVQVSPSKKAKKYFVTMSHVNAAIQEMFASAKVVAIQALSFHEKLALRAIGAEFRRTGVEECVFHNVDSQYRTLARLEGVAPLHSSLLSRILCKMASSRLLMLSDSKNDFQQKISLNATVDDVDFALREQDDFD